MTISIPLIVCAIGALFYFATDAKPAEAGRLAFIIGLFWTLAAVVGVKLF